MKKKVSKKKKPAKFQIADIRPAKLTFIVSMILALVLQSVPLTHVAKAADVAGNKVAIDSAPFILGLNQVATVDGLGQQAGTGVFEAGGTVDNYPEGACLPFSVAVSHDADETGDITFSVLYDYHHQGNGGGESIGIADIENISPSFPGDPRTNASNLSNFTYFPDTSFSSATFNSEFGPVSATITGPFSGSSGASVVTDDDDIRHYSVTLPSVPPSTDNQDPENEVFVLLCARLGVDASSLPGSSLSIKMDKGGGGSANTPISPDNLLELPSLTLTKVVSSGSASPADFDFVVFPAINGETQFDTSLVLNSQGDPIVPLIASVTIPNVSPNGTYTITEETELDGYSFVSGTGTSCTFGTVEANTSETAFATVAAGDSATNATCSFTNAADASGLTVTKNVVNDNGGQAVAGDFDITITNVDTDEVVIVEGSEAGTSVALGVGTYTVTESGPTGYAEDFDACGGGTITIGEAEQVDCAITNNDIAPTLTVTKVVTNDNGGTAVVSDFPLFVNAGSVTSGVQTVLDAGSYTVSETTLAGYVGTISGDCAADGSITLLPGENKACTITNNDAAPGLTVVKAIVNDNGGTAVVSDFTLHVTNGSDVDTNVTSGVSNTFAAGSYTVSESGGPAGYTATFSAECPNGNVTLAVGEAKVCTITNNDPVPPPTPGSIIVRKTVVGGTLSDSDFTMHVKNSLGLDAVIPFPGNDVGTEVPVDPGTYTVSEDVVAEYVATFSGDCDANGEVAIGEDETLTCIVTNTFQDIEEGVGIIKVVKVVTNDDEGSALVNAFTLLVDQTPVISGAETEFSPGTYTISETGGPGGYTASFSGACDENGVLLLGEGQILTCTITNDDNDPPPPTNGTLTVRKIVINDDEGTSVATDFSFTVNNGGAIAFEDSDDENLLTGENSLSLPFGTYSVSETTALGYSVSFENCSEVTVGSEPVICTITNDDNEPQASSFTLTLTTNGDGHGRIEGQLEDIFCDTDTEEDICSHQYEEGTVVTITAFPDEGSNFDSSWSGGCSGNNPVCQITMSGNVNVNAHFALNQITSSGNGGGGGGCGTCGVLPAGALTFPTIPSILPPGQVLGLVDEVPAAPAPAPTVLGEVNELPVTGVPLTAIALMVTPLLWVLRRKE